MFPQYRNWDLAGYDTGIANSQFTARYMKEYWGIDADVIYPPVNIKQFSPKAKANWIVSVGRFFDVPGGNNKNHILLINQFKRFAKDQNEPWELHLVGTVQNDDYYKRVLQAIAGDKRIILHHDISRQRYINLMARARMLWSATGYGAKSPSSCEHFGISAVEAMASGAVPIVHNSGGMPETNSLVWDEPGDLIRLSNEVSKGYDLKEWIGKAQKFSIEEQGNKLIEVIEKPIAIPPGNKFRIYLPEKPPESIRVGVISDSPRLTSGFGVVTKMVVEGLLKTGFPVSCLGMYDIDAVRDEVLPYRLWNTSPHEPSGLQSLVQFIRGEKPSVLYINYDLGNILAIFRTLQSHGINIPPICYVPIEGEPLLPIYLDTIRAVYQRGGVPIVYTEWGKQVVEAQDGPKVKAVLHGSDHAPFMPMTKEPRLEMRRLLGWTGKFVVMFAGRNKSSKGFDRIIEAADILRNENVLFYLHTNPDEQSPLQPWPLRDMIKIRGLNNIVFPPDLVEQFSGPKYNEGRKVKADDFPNSQTAYLAATSMIERYQVSDTYVDASYREGFGLPPLEAMACGVPVIAPNDKGIRREVLGDAAMFLEPIDWGTSHLAAYLCEMSGKAIAKAILELRNNQDLKDALIRRGLERAGELKWKPLQDEICRNALEIGTRFV